MSLQIAAPRFAFRFCLQAATIWANEVNHNGHALIKNPEVLGGEPVFRGTRVPFKVLIDYLEGGDTLDQFLEQYPSVTRELARRSHRRSAP